MKFWTCIFSGDRMVSNKHTIISRKHNDFISEFEAKNVIKVKSRIQEAQVSRMQTHYAQNVGGSRICSKKAF